MDVQKLRVAQVIGKLADGGVEAVVNNYCRHTDAARIQFDYIIDDDSEYLPSRDVLERGTRYYKIPSTRRLPARVRAMEALFRQNSYAVVHAHMNTLNAPVLYAAWRAGVPVRISHNHSMANARERGRSAAKLLLRRTGAWFATMDMACGEAAGRWFFGDRAFDSGRVTVLPNAIDLDAYSFSPERRAALRRSLGAADRPVVGHASRFVPMKNHEYLLLIFKALLARVPDAVLWLVGEGKIKTDIQALASEMGLGDRVFFLGKRADLNALYSAMDCFVLPSLYEGVPMVGVEAQTAGLPCFFSDQVPREVALLDSAEFLPLKANPEVWADAIAASLSASNAHREDAADRLRGSLFDLEQSGKMLEQIYASACGLLC